MLSAIKELQSAVAKTSRKTYDYTNVEVVYYIQQILNDGFKLKHTKLSSNARFVEAQYLNYKHLIREVVKESCFGFSKFKIPELAVQRSAIEHSSTLHSLRQNVKAIIGPLKLYLHYNNTVEPEQDCIFDIDAIVQELEDTTKKLIERDRMLSEIMKLYDGSALKGDRLLAAIDNFKIEHSASDEEAGKVFGVSRSYVARLRRDSKVFSN